LLLAPIAILASSFSAIAEDIESGNFWLMLCKNESTFCTGYVAAMAHMQGLYRQNINAIGRPPKGVTVGQNLKVITRYLEDHPAELHQPFILLAVRALNESFPCPPNTASVNGTR